MKAGILYGPKNIRMGEMPEPEIGADEVLLESHVAGICGTDLHIYRGEFENRVRYPAVQGHEFGGVIVEVGKNVRDYKPGDRVVVDPIISCHHCPACLSGHINACQTLKLLGVELKGGFGQLVAVPVDRIFRLPDNIPMKHAPMVEMYSLGHHVLQRGEVQPGETVAILGAGKLGLSVLDVLCHSVNPGVSIVSDLQPFRLETARKLGADHAIDLHKTDLVKRVLELTNGIGVDCVIECVGHYHEVRGQDAPLAQAVKMIRNGGRIVTAGLGEQTSAVHFKTLVIKEAKIIASRVTCGEFPRAIQMMSRGLLHPDLLITDVQPLASIGEAFDQVDRESPETIKVVLQVKEN
ncbi:MAG TPA: alcohol dehydrogenase catalytic domain-containing protein [Anaerolineales bacterium]|nr:alcohol dehydrogenase catalytic domain-containing protein [Anaerolineales bacterium]